MESFLQSLTADGMPLVHVAVLVVFLGLAIRYRKARDKGRQNWVPARASSDRLARGDGFSRCPGALRRPPSPSGAPREGWGGPAWPLRLPVLGSSEAPKCAQPPEVQMTW
jgi:hypothetical protein